MICNYCQKSPSKLDTHFKADQIKERLNPTYTHTHIFNPDAAKPLTVRCTPTFHSTAFDLQGYRPITNQHLKKETNQQKKKDVSFQNVRSQRKQQSHYISTKGGDLRVKHQWYDTAKEQLLNSLQCFTQRYSRDRKLADLSSNPVFGGATLQIIKPLSNIDNKMENIALKETKQVTYQAEKQQIIVNQVPKYNSQSQQKDRQVKTSHPETKITTKKQQIIQPEEKKQAHPVKSVTSKVDNHTYSIKNQITFGKTEKVGRRLNKTTAVQSSKPAFTIIKNRRA